GFWGRRASGDGSGRGVPEHRWRPLRVDARRCSCFLSRPFAVVRTRGQNFSHRLQTTQLKETFGHKDNVSGLEEEVAFASYSDVLDRDSQLRLLSVDDASDVGAVARRLPGEAACQCNGLDDRHVPLIRERPRFLDLTKNEYLL